MPNPTPAIEPAPAERPLLPNAVVACAAFVCALSLSLQAALGPLGSNEIRYRTSTSGLWQIAGGDLVNAYLISPLLIAGGILLLRGRSSAKFLLVLTPLTVIYSALGVGVANEWTNPAYSGNSERYAWMFIVQVAASTILLVGTLPLFKGEDAPTFSRRGLTFYIAFMVAFLTMFALMWIGELIEVTRTGGTANGAYAAAPTAFWLVRFVDLGVVIPLGFIALYLLYSQPKRAYALVLLFFGFFVTLGTAVNAMAAVMVMHGDPAVQGGALVIFPVLGALAWGGLFFLVRPKLKDAMRVPPPAALAH